MSETRVIDGRTYTVKHLRSAGLDAERHCSQRGHAAVGVRYIARGDPGRSGSVKRRT